MVIQCDDKMMRIYICFTILLLEMSVIRNEDSAKKAEKEEDGKITSRSFTYRMWMNNKKKQFQATVKNDIDTLDCILSSDELDDADMQ